MIVIEGVRARDSWGGGRFKSVHFCWGRGSGSEFGVRIFVYICIAWGEREVYLFWIVRGGRGVAYFVKSG